MPVRAVLNTVYALLVKDLDADGRKQFDDELYAFTAANEKATKALWGTDTSGGGSR